MSTTMSTSVDDPAADPAATVDRYRPNASTARVHAAIESAMHDIIATATGESANFLHLSQVDENAGTAIVYGHLVDASECLEVAAEHLDRLKAIVAYRLRIEDDKNGADLPF